HQVFVRRAEGAVLFEDFLHVTARGGLSEERTRGPESGEQAHQGSSQQHGRTPRGAIQSGGLWPILRLGERLGSPPSGRAGGCVGWHDPGKSWIKTVACG